LEGRRGEVGRGVPEADGLLRDDELGEQGGRTGEEVRLRGVPEAPAVREHGRRVGRAGDEAVEGAAAGGPVGGERGGRGLAVVLAQGDGEAEAEPSERAPAPAERLRSEEHTSELQSRENLVCRLLLEKKK